jgi:hypothetical protein
MDLNTYSGLQETSLSVVGRDGDTALMAYVPVAVTLAEAKINGNLQVGRMENPRRAQHQRRVHAPR